MVKSITCVQDEIDRFSAGLKKDPDYMKCRVDDESRRTLNDFGAWVAQRVVQAQQTLFEASKMTVMQYTSGWGCSLKERKRKHTSAVSKPVVLKDHLKMLLASLQEGAYLRGQVKPSATNVAEGKSPGADDPFGSEMKSPKVDDLFGPEIQYPGADDPVFDDAEVDKLFVNTSGTDN